jgi:hypothetical protein
MLHKWQSDVMDNKTEEEEEEDISGEIGRRRIQERAAAFQKRRPKMDGVENKNKINGGRALKSKTTQKDYNPDHGDDDFIRDSGVSSVVQTPTDTYVQDTDGELILEDYYLNEALASGKKQSTSRRKY